MKYFLQYSNNLFELEEHRILKLKDNVQRQELATQQLMTTLDMIRKELVQIKENNVKLNAELEESNANLEGAKMRAETSTSAALAANLLADQTSSSLNALQKKYDEQTVTLLSAEACMFYFFFKFQVFFSYEILYVTKLF